MDRYEYIWMKLYKFPKHTIQQYDLCRKAKNGTVYLKICQSLYGVLQAGKLANNYLPEKLRPSGYYVTHTPGLWKHSSRPFQHSRVVSNFGVKYTDKEHADYLIKTLKKEFTISDNWEGILYCDITLKWDYENRMLDILIPGYILKALQQYKYEQFICPQYLPYPIAPQNYGAAAQ